MKTLTAEAVHGGTGLRRILQSASTLLRRGYTTPHTIVLYAVASVVSAILFQRRDPLTAWDAFLNVHFGLLLPIVAFALACGLPHRNGASLQSDEQRSRFGMSRRKLVAQRYLGLLVVGVVLTLLPLLWGRALTLPVPEMEAARDGLLCVGIGLLATTTYISFLGAMAHAGGRWAAGAALFYDLTLGHSRGVWAALSPHPYVAELLGSAGVFIFDAHASSWMLGAAALTSAAWIFFRTRP
jgi:hypothetical protein